MWTCSSEPYLQPQKGGASDAWTQAGGTQRIIHAGEMPPPDEVAAALGIPPQLPAVGRCRLISLHGQPFEVTASWWSAAIGRGTALAEPGRIKGGAVTLLAQLGFAVHRVVEDLWATSATADDAVLLGLAPGSPVLMLFRTAFDSRGLPFQVDVMTRQADARQRYKLTTN